MLLLCPSPIILLILLIVAPVAGSAQHATSLNTGRTAQEMIMSGLKESINSLSTSFYYEIARNGKAPFAKAEMEESSSGVDNSQHSKFTTLGRQVEQWAENILSEDNSELFGWKSIECNSAFNRKYNPDGSTKQYVKWMRDSREDRANAEDIKNHPCMKLYATIDAPFPIVCRFLSQKAHYREYNSLLVDQRDIEEVAPDTKICWSQTKKLLFIQPRDFVTYCYHRWRRDGTQVIVNQAFDHPEEQGVGLRAYALRGATFISRDKADPDQKTRIILLAHCNCGDDIPEWAVRTAVSVLAPIKPFEIIHRIRVGIERGRNELDRAEKMARNQSGPNGRSSRPAGMAQMGYSCFWPEGGGVEEDQC